MINDMKKVEEKRKKAIERWKKGDVELRAGYSPTILQET